MAKLQNSVFLKNSKGQSFVEYILLLAVLSAVGFSFYNSKQFKEFMSGKTGFFLALKEGMEYSYRYGMQMPEGTDVESATGFSYNSGKHELYYNKDEGKSRFFSGVSEYGKTE